MSFFQNRRIVLFGLLFISGIAVSQTYTFSHETITKLKFIGKQSWEEQRAFSSPSKNYVMTFTILPNIFQAAIRDFNSMQQHQFNVEMEIKHKDTVYQFVHLRTTKITNKDFNKNNSLQKK